MCGIMRIFNGRWNFLYEQVVVVVMLLLFIGTLTTTSFDVGCLFTCYSHFPPGLFTLLCT